MTNLKGDLRQLAIEAERYGFVFDGYGGSGHPRFRHRDTGDVRFSAATPSDWRSNRNLLAVMRRLDQGKTVNTVVCQECQEPAESLSTRQWCDGCEETASQLVLAGDDGQSLFDTVRSVRKDGSEFWSARDLCRVMRYDQWRNFAAAVDRGRVSICNQQGEDAGEHHIAGASKLIDTGKGAKRAVDDYHLTRFGAYMVVMNGDPRKPEIAAAQAYFATKTREAETAAPGVDLASVSRRELALMIIDAEDRADRESAARVEAENYAKELEPLAASQLALVEGEGDYATNDAAKVLSRDPGIQIGGPRLYAYMAGLGWVFKKNGRWKAYQTQISNGRLAMKQANSRFWHKDREEWVLSEPTVRITPKGLHELHRLLRGVNPPSALVSV